MILAMVQTYRQKWIMTINYKTCPNCANIVEGKRKDKIYCQPNCRKRYWDKTHRDYYKNYYWLNRDKAREYYIKRKVKYKILNKNLYKGRKEVILTKA